MSPSKRAAWAYGAAAAAVGAVAASKIGEAWRYAAASDPASASDSLPLYLGAKAVNQGLDPTDEATMEAVYASMDVNVTKALFSVLYPPSIHVMLQPLAELSYYGFLYYWRIMLLAVLVCGMAAAGSAGLSRARAPLGAALAVLGAFVFFPLFIDVQLVLGQANVGIAGLLGLAMGAVARGWATPAALVAVVGAGVKLVPAVLVWPLLWARRWRALAVATGFGLVVAGLTLAHVPLGRVLDNLASTLAFQQTVEPHWLHERSLPDWGRFLAFLRRPALLMLSLGLTAMAVWSNRFDVHRRREVSAVGMGLLATALAADSAGVGAYYATMAIPGMAVLISWPLSAHASRLSWVGVPAAGMVLWLTDGGLIYNTPDVELKLVLACTVMWVAIALRMIQLSRPWTGLMRIGAVLAVAVALTHASIWTWNPPFGGHKTMPDAAPGSLTTPEAPPAPPLPPGGMPPR